jgi:hypothetical protein
MTPHEVSLLKGYMQDLIEQARQDSFIFKQAGYREQEYDADHALMDLLALLDDRIESEGVQVGLSHEFPHRMWGFCQRAQVYVKDNLWFAQNWGQAKLTKSQIREVTYKALLEYIEKAPG